MASEANERTGGQGGSGGSTVSRLLPYAVGAGAGVLIYGSTLRWFPLVSGTDSPFFYPLLGLGFVATIAAVWWRWGRGEVLKQPYTWVSWVIGAFLMVGVVAVGVGGAFTAWGVFVTLNGALDFGAAKQRPYTVAKFHEDCGGGRASDKSYYLLEPGGAGGSYGTLRARVNCSDDEGLPVDGGGTVPVGGEVVVEVKPGAFGEPWQAGYGKG
jgi:hypothetical protein